jgi:hypothetical protein
VPRCESRRERELLFPVALRKVRVCEGAAHESAARGSLRDLAKGLAALAVLPSLSIRYRMYLILTARRREREMGTVPKVLTVLLIHSIRYKMYLLSSWEKFMFPAI